jgi:hypothetical protein
MLFTAYLIIANEQFLVNHYLLDFGFRFTEIPHAISVAQIEAKKPW